MGLACVSTRLDFTRELPQICTCSFSLFLPLRHALLEEEPETEGGEGGRLRIQKRQVLRSWSEPMCANVLSLPSQGAVQRGLAASKQTAAHCSVDIQAPPEGRRDVEPRILQVGTTAFLRFSSRSQTFFDQP
jgi:hypothetical protein